MPYTSGTTNASALPYKNVWFCTIGEANNLNAVCAIQGTFPPSTKINALSTSVSALSNANCARMKLFVMSADLDIAFNKESAW